MFSAIYIALVAAFAGVVITLIRMGQKEKRKAK